MDATSIHGYPYEALDGTGRPYMRMAKVIGELPYEHRERACINAATGIGALLGQHPFRAVPFGAPVYTAFHLTRPEAKAHQQTKLLMICGCDVPLSYCVKLNSAISLATKMLLATNIPTTGTPGK